MNRYIKNRIIKFYKEGYSKSELLIMYEDQDWKEVLRAIRNVKRGTLV